MSACATSRRAPTRRGGAQRGAAREPQVCGAGERRASSWLDGSSWLLRSLHHQGQLPVGYVALPKPGHTSAPPPCTPTYLQRRAAAAAATSAAACGGAFPRGSTCPPWACRPASRGMGCRRARGRARRAGPGTQVVGWLLAGCQSLQVGLGL